MDRARVALIVQRYGLEVNGGAELHCRLIAEQLAARHDVEVLTSCAVDYASWRNEYPAGSSLVNGVPVIRFPVAHERDRRRFNQHSAWLFSNPHTRDDELRWIHLQGPHCPGLISQLSANPCQYDAYIFVTYLYSPTCLGLPLVGPRAALVPTAHDEAPIYLGIYDEVFGSARELFFNTVEEKDFVLRRFCMDERGTIVGIGVTPAQAPEQDSGWDLIREKTGDSQLLTYVGRIDESKGCAELFEHFMAYLSSHPDRNLKLLLLGKPVMPIPEHPAIVHAGFVPESTKLKAIAESHAVVIPSPFESLSMVALEAWTLGKPVLVNGDCDVLRGQCRRSQGGLWYTSHAEFEACLDRLLHDRNLRTALGNQGRRWTLTEHSWQRVNDCYDRFIESTRTQPR